MEYTEGSNACEAAFAKSDYDKYQLCKKVLDGTLTQGLGNVMQQLINYI